MTSSPIKMQDLEQAAARLVGDRLSGDRLVGETVLALEAAGIGANSTTFRVTTNFRNLALKCYPRRAADTRDRLDVEWRALTFLRAQGLEAVPAALARDDANRLMLMEWLEGDPVTNHMPADLEAAIAFMTRIFAASDTPEAAQFPPASEACLSAAEISAQIDARLAAFSPHPLLDEFLSDVFVPRLKSASAAHAGEIDENLDLPPRLRRLIPADFGFHNALRSSAGALRFIDFDYFGWDDPVKLTADFVLHPAMSLTPAEQQLVIERLAGALPQDERFLARLDRHKPLYALRWALILLNPFRRDRMAELPQEDAALLNSLQGQIEKAGRMCEAAVI